MKLVIPPTVPALVRVAIAALVATAGGCTVRPEKHQPGYLGDGDKTIEYYLPHDRQTTESRSDGVHKLNFGRHAMAFENSRIELDGTTLWARRYRNVVLRGDRGAELLLTVDGRRVPTHVHLD